MTVDVALQLVWLSVVLAIVTVVDARTQTIPDTATASLAIGGLAFAAVDSLSAVGWTVVSGALYFSLFWALRQGHWRLTGRIGMGFGDVKLAGAAGLWLTPALLPVFMGFAAFAALLSVGAVAMFADSGILRRRIPFGPFLALGLLACWVIKVSNPVWEFV